MASNLRPSNGGDQPQSQPQSQSQGISQALRGGNTNNLGSQAGSSQQAEAPQRLVLKNRAGESKSPYVRAHASNPVAWQVWGDEAIELAKKENRLLFVSIGYSACHWCHVMERESFENEEIAAILNDAFIPVKVDREERPDIDRIYMNFVQATTGSGGWPLNVFVTPDLEPVFGGTYWPGPASSGNNSKTSFEDQVDFLGILNKLSSVWRDQEDRCRQDAAQILQRLKDFAAEGTFGDKLGQGNDGLDIELLEETTAHFASTFDSANGGFGSAPKFPTPSKLAFLLRLSLYPDVVQDIVGPSECQKGRTMALTTLKKMARGGIRDHIGHGFARYSVTPDWSLPHFEKMLYDNAQLLHAYLDGFLLSNDAELLGVVYDISTYLTTTLAHPDGGFYSSEDADSFYKPGDTEKREGAFYVWTKREFGNVLGPQSEPILSAFFNVSSHGNVAPENDAHDEFIDQNVLTIVSNPMALASTFGVKEEEVVKIIKNGKAALKEHREKARVRPAMDDKIVVGWNGIAIGALARVATAMKPFDRSKSAQLYAAAIKAATFIKDKLYDADKKVLYRVWREGRGETQAFADDYAFLIEGLIDLYEATFDEKWLRWADELQQTQINLFYDTTGSGAFFSTQSSAPDVILRLKDGMDTSEPSTNGTSASNLYRLSSSLSDESYAKKGKETLAGFESEMLQYPWLFASFMPSIVARHLGLRSIVLTGGVDAEIQGIANQLRGGLGSIVRLYDNSAWLRERNPYFKDLALDGKTRTLVCENGVCREEVPRATPSAQPTDAQGAQAGQALDLSAVGAALPAQQQAGSSGTSQPSGPSTDAKLP